MSETRIALVTGASYGIGAATAAALARDGYDVAVSDLSAATLADTVARIEATGRRGLALALDLREQDSIERAMAGVLSAFGQLDLLVNNAGVPQRKPVLEVGRADWDAAIGVNLTGTYFMSQAMGRYLIGAGRPGAIVSVASTHGITGLANSSVYGIAKAGVIHMTRMLAIEWAQHGIRVNAIAPASTVTPTRTGTNDPVRREYLLSRIPLHRLGDAEDMAAAIVYLASPQASFITGHTLVLDGGLTAY